MPHFDPEEYARPLCTAGTLAVFGGLYSGAAVGWPVALLGVALLLTACYSRRDGFLLFGPFARADAVRSARSRRTHLVRAGVALAAGAVIVFNGYDFLPYYFQTYASRNQQAAYVHQQVVNSFAFGIGFVVPVLTVILVSGAIAEERGKKRWEVLLTTDLRGRELVFGKLLGKLWLVVEPVVVILPVLAMLPLIVGVPVQLMLLFGGAVAVTVFALAGVAAAVSAQATTRGGAAGGVVAFVAIYLVASAALCGAALYSARYYPGLLDFPRSAGVKNTVLVADLVEFANAANPATTYLYAAVMTPPIGTAVPSLGGALRQYSAGAIGVFLVGTLLACRRVRSARDPNPAKGTGERRPGFLGRGKPRESVQEMRAKLRPPVSDEPLAWWANCRGLFRTEFTPWRKVARNWAITVAALLSLYAIDIVGRNSVYPLLSGYWKVNDWPLSGLVGEGVVVGVPFLLLALAVLIPVATAAQSISKERADDTFDSLRLTPLSAREMLEQIRAGCLTTNRLGVAVWTMPTLATVVTGFFPPLFAVAWGLLALAVTPPLVNFALYCSAWASSPARATRNLVFGGIAWHYFLLFLGMAVFVGIPEVLGLGHVTQAISRSLIEPHELVRLKARVWPGPSLPLFARYALSVTVYGGALALYWLVGRWVFRRAVGRLARSRDATG